MRFSSFFPKTEIDHNPIDQNLTKQIYAEVKLAVFQTFFIRLNILLLKIFQAVIQSMSGTPLKDSTPTSL